MAVTVQTRTAAAPRPGAVLILIRAGLLGSATLAVASWAHASADGNLPGPAGMFWIWLVTTLVVAPLLSKQASMKRIVALLCLGQTGLHLLLSMVAGHGSHLVPQPASAYYASNSMLDPHGPSAAVLGDSSAVAITDLLAGLISEVTTVDGLMMTIAHLAGAAAVGVWLATGERVLWGSLQAIARLLNAGAEAINTLLGQLLIMVGLHRPVRPGQQWPDWFSSWSSWVDVAAAVTPRRGPPGIVTS